jgi:Ca2+-binding EF-hand superfamily protein
MQFFDEDGSGFITRQEMTDQFAELGGLLTADEINRFHDILDSDGNGVIDVSFAQLCTRPCSLLNAVLFAALLAHSY